MRVILMRVSDSNDSASNVIKLVERLRTINADNTTISLYAEKMIDENTGETIYY